MQNYCSEFCISYNLHSERKVKVLGAIVIKYENDVL